MTTPRSPPISAPAGRAIWANVTGRFEIDVPELAVLSNACRTADLLDALAERIPRDLKAVSESRHHSMNLARLVASLRLPDDDGATPPALTASPWPGNTRRSARAPYRLHPAG